MNTLLTQLRRRPKAGFTLVELLIVITIIAILAGLAFPAYTIVIESANKARASAMANQLKNGMNSYSTDYGRFPKIGTGTDDTTIDSAANWTIVSAMLNGAKNIDDQTENSEAKDLNPRKTAYLSFNVSDYKQGNTIYEHVVTPWDTQVLYTMKYDSDYDNVLEELPTKDDDPIDLGADVAVWVEDPESSGNTKVNTYE